MFSGDCSEQAAQGLNPYPRDPLSALLPLRCPHLPVHSPTRDGAPSPPTRRWVSFWTGQQPEAAAPGEDALLLPGLRGLPVPFEGHVCCTRLDGPSFCNRTNNGSGCLSRLEPIGQRQGGIM